MTEEPRPAQRSPLAPAFIAALVGAFLAFSSVMLVTLLYLVLMGGRYELWVAPLWFALRMVATPFAAVVFVFTLVLMYRRLQ
ncbi:MAG: hypothetical protein ACRD2Q_06115 [Terriglobales bacterium]